MKTFVVEYWIKEFADVTYSETMRRISHIDTTSKSIHGAKRKATRFYTDLDAYWGKWKSMPHPTTNKKEWTRVSSYGQRITVYELTD